MELQELEKQALKLPISDRKALVESLLISIEQETETFTPPILGEESILNNLNSWTKSLIGVIEINEETNKESYVKYLEEKYS